MRTLSLFFFLAFWPFLSFGQKELSINELDSLYQKGKYFQCFEAINQKDESPEFLQLQANLHEKLGRYYVADSLIRLAVDGFKSQPNHKKEYAKALTDYGYILTITDQFDQANDVLQEAKTLQEKLIGKDHLDYATTLDYLGLLRLERNKYPEAKAYYLESLAIKEKQLDKNSIPYLKTLNYLGEWFLENDDYAASEKYYNQILSSIDKSHPFYAVVLNNQGRFFLQLGEYEKAELSFEECIKVREKTVGLNHPRHARTLMNYGDIYFYTEDLKKAKKLFLESKTIYEATIGENNSSYASTLSYLGVIAIHLMEDHNVENYFQKAAIVFKELRMSKDHGTVISNIGWYYLVEKKNFKKAVPFLTKGLKILEENNHKGLAYFNNKLNLAFSNKQIGNTSIAVSQMEEAYQGFLKNFSENHENHILFASTLAEIYEANNQIIDAKNAYLKSINTLSQRVKYIYPSLYEENRLYFLDNLQYDFYYYNSFLLRHQKSFPDFSRALQESYLATKGLGLELSMKKQTTLAAAADSSMIQKQKDWISIREKIANSYGESNEVLIKNQINIEELNAQAKKLEKELSRMSRDFNNIFSKNENSYSYADLTSKLKSNEVVIDFIRYYYFDGLNLSDTSMLCAFVTKENFDTPKIIPLGKEKLIDSLISLSPHQEGSYIQNYALNHQLYKALWQPLEKELEGNNTIIISADGVLHRIPFHALNMGKGKLLVEKYDFHYFNSLRDFIRKERKELPTLEKNIALWGGIKYDASIQSEMLASRGIPDSTTRSSFKYLRGTKTEIDTISNLATKNNWKKIKSGGTNALEQNLQQFTGSNAPTILHFATHGFAFNQVKDDSLFTENTGEARARKNPNPKFRAGLAFANANDTWSSTSTIPANEDGILTAYEIEVMDFSKTKLVVLSACETGLGKTQANEGVLGLQSAFKTSGVDALIVSLWKIPDTETVEFMEIFYKNYFVSNDARSAFRKAQLEMYQNYDPYYWGAFKLVE